jgi:hypothetical protein
MVGHSSGQGTPVRLVDHQVTFAGKDMARLYPILSVISICCPYISFV